MIKIKPSWWIPRDERWLLRYNHAPSSYSARGLTKAIHLSAGWPGEAINGICTGPVGHYIVTGNTRAEFTESGPSPKFDYGSWYTNAANSDFWHVQSSCGLNGANAATIVVGAYADSPGTNNLYVQAGNATTGDPRFGFAFTYSNMTAHALAQGTTAYGIAASQPGGWHSWAVVFNGNKTGNAERLKLYRDDAPVALTYTGTVPATLSTTFNRFEIGRQWVNAAANYGYGWYVQVYIYNRALEPGALYPMMATTGTSTAGRTHLKSFINSRLPMHYHGQAGGAAMFRNRAASRAKFAGQHRMVGAGQ